LASENGSVWLSTIICKLYLGERLWPNPPRFLHTIADGIRLQQLGDLTWPIILELVEKDVFSVVCEHFNIYVIGI
jgi:hypothetical protein